MKIRPAPVFGWLILMAALVSNTVLAQVRINEVMADNGGDVTAPGGGNPDYIEIMNVGGAATNIGGWKLTDSTSSSNTNLFLIPANTIIPAGGYLVFWLDAQTNGPGPGLHVTSFSLNGKGDVISLFKSSTLVDQVAFGLQVKSRPICRIPNGIGGWFLGMPTPGATNAFIPLGTPFALRINEWLPTNSLGADKDRLEIYNPKTNGPVMLGGPAGVLITGSLVVPDTNTPLVTANSYIGPGENVRFNCDGTKVKTGEQADHLNFKLSSTAGDTVSIFLSDRTTLIDQISFGTFTNLPLRGQDISMGRFPDGGDNIVFFSTNNTTLGSANSSCENITNIVISEVLTHTDPPFEDAIEIYNPTDTAVDISNWWLSNSQDRPQKFHIPAGTTLAPHAYKVFYEQSTSNAPPSAPGFNQSGTGEFPDFTLNSAHGDNVVLTWFGTSPSVGGSNTVFQLNHAFEAAENGVSFGRYIKSDGGADLVAMTAHTFGADNASTPQSFRTGTGLPNALPKVGPMVISEIMYHPPDIGTNDNTLNEFIELANIAATPQPLYDTAYPTNTWSIDGAGKFTFPTGVTVPVGGHVLIVNFDPATNAVELAAFRNTYSVPANVPVFGPLGGKLDNSSETIYLYKPDAVQLPPHLDAGYVPRVLVEKVKYEDLPPWPAEADGLGYSLQRLSLTGYSNDHTNWYAGPPTAGFPNATAVPVFATEMLPNGSFNLEFATTPGRSYVVEGSTNLAQSSWTTITNFIATDTNTTVTDNTAFSLLKYRFYRVKGL